MCTQEKKPMQTFFVLCGNRSISELQGLKQRDTVTKLLWANKWCGALGTAVKVENATDGTVMLPIAVLIPINADPGSGIPFHTSDVLHGSHSTRIVERVDSLPDFKRLVAWLAIHFANSSEITECNKFSDRVKSGNPPENQTSAGIWYNVWVSLTSETSRRRTESDQRSVLDVGDSIFRLSDEWIPTIWAWNLMGFINP